MAAEFLREAREARGLSLSEIAAQTRISPTILQRLERGDFQGVPAGLYVRAYLKAYASAVGLDPEQTVRVLDPLLPRADDSFSTIVQTAVSKKPPVAEPAATVRAEPLSLVAKLPFPTAAPLKIELDDAAAATSRLRLFAAAAFDAGLLALVNLGVVYLAALTCGVAVPVMLGFAAPAMAILCGTVTMVYFALLGGVAGRTAGAWMVKIRIIDSPQQPMDLQFVFRRTLQCLVREASGLIGLRVLEAGWAGSGSRAGGPRSATATLTPFPDRIRSA